MKIQKEAEYIKKVTKVAEHLKDSDTEVAEIKKQQLIVTKVAEHLKDFDDENSVKN